MNLEKLEYYKHRSRGHLVIEIHYQLHDQHGHLVTEKPVRHKRFDPIRICIQALLKRFSLWFVRFFFPFVTFTITGSSKDTMVSIRRQRLIKLYGRTPFLDFLSSYGNGKSPGCWVQNTRSAGMHLSPSVDIDHHDEKNTKSEEPESSIVNESSSSYKQQPVSHPEVKRRKRHRRKHFENQEACVMRGVYYKNMKWQAAIKVEKKQIHLGTVSSQEEAARLYDRAAFMCGREPNFELTVEEKDELSQLSWDDFLAMTRSAINSKKSQRRVSSRMKFENQQQNNSDSEAEANEGGNGFSGSDDADTSVA
ncbi:unnamed protein product [Lactuca virosa]|uniref:AP2/ERF domain-containing protein n=1 Tax=Lactuca virosa TaxID=75947 RepID=A0AAU9N266_9ASTR|nr:unnamed protein product [Lactuca virosa]